MIPKLQNFGLPLLLKELLEQSARRRTYLTRMAYAGLLFLICLSSLISSLPSGANPLNHLGFGLKIYRELVTWQFAGIYVFLPAMVCGALTVEKEQNTLGLLFLTKLGPWTIVFEKLLSGLIPMSCLLLCSVPLMAFSYSLGGIETPSLFAGIWMIAVAVFQIGCITLACSAYCRTSTSALLTSYSTIALLTFAIGVVDHVLFADFIFDLIVQTARTFDAVRVSAPHDYPDVYMYAFSPAIQFSNLVDKSVLPFGNWSALLMGIPSLFSGCVALILARLWVVRRAFVPPSNVALTVLRFVDQIFQKLNNSLGRGILIFNEGNSVPDSRPIAWRETHKRALGQFRYLLRVFLLITVPAALLTVMIMIRESAESNLYETSISSIVPLLWLVSALLISVSAAGLISGERSRQTLNVLLATPLNGRRMILEKLAGTNRLIWVCTVPLVACILFDGYWRASLGQRPGSGVRTFQYWEYLVAAFSFVLIYPRLLAWLSLWIGLKSRTGTRATVIVLIFLVAWCILPIIIVITGITMFSNGPGTVEHTGAMMLLQFSPLALLIQSEFGEFREFCEIPFLPIAINCVWYGTWYLVIRWSILRSADRLLGRMATPV